MWILCNRTYLEKRNELQNFKLRSISQYNGELERKNMLYKLADFNLSEEELLSGLFPDGVLCMNSALYYHGYIDYAPANWCIAISKDTSKSRFKIEYPYVKPFYMEESQLFIGAEKQFLGGSKMWLDSCRLIRLALGNETVRQLS